MAEVERSEKITINVGLVDLGQAPRAVKAALAPRTA